MKRALLVCAVLVLATIAPAFAGTLTEDFNAPFPAWESGWFGTNSNAQNFYGVGQGRGNNPDGLWIDDPLRGDQDVLIQFNAGFAATLTSIYFDVAGYVPTNLRIFDASGVTLLNVAPIFDTYGAYTLPGTYVNYGVTSSTGIGGFEFYGSVPEGNTSIDNVVVTTGVPTPEPGTLVLLATGLLGGIGSIRRKLMS